MADMLNKLSELLKFSPSRQAQAAPQIGGMVGQAQQILQSRPYQLHVQEMQAQGLQPLTPEEFAAQYMQQAPRNQGMIAR